MRRARDEIAQIRDGATGKVSVAVSTSVALTVLPAAFKDFHARLPAVDVQFSEAVLPWMLARLRDGQLDFAVAHVMPGTLDAAVREPSSCSRCSWWSACATAIRCAGATRCGSCTRPNGCCPATASWAASRWRRCSRRWA